MKVFHEQEPWPDKVNFVDENEVHLGYDTHDDCCARGGWFLSDNKAAWLDSKTDKEEAFVMKSMDLIGWTFDPSYFVKRSLPGDYSDGDAVQFRIVNGTFEKFITLYNHHNGYYSKGFEFTVANDVNKSQKGTI